MNELIIRDVVTLAALCATVSVLQVVALSL